jgi:hypothetical protein
MSQNPWSPEPQVIRRKSYTQLWALQSVAYPTTPILRVPYYPVVMCRDRTGVVLAGHNGRRGVIQACIY